MTTTSERHSGTESREWDEFLKYNWETIFDSMKREPWVFDGRNIINTDKLKAIGFNTYSIGR